MKYFNELNEAYERTMLARAEPEKEKSMHEILEDKPKDAEIYDWDQFMKWSEMRGEGDVLMDWWDCWKEAYIAGVESTAEEGGK